MPSSSLRLQPAAVRWSSSPLAQAVTLALASLAAPAWAQEAAQPAAAASAPAKLQAVMVTAERVSENIKDVPSAVSTLGGEALDVLNASGQDLRMLSGRVPSLNIESSFGRAFPRFYLRGYGNADFRLNASQPVSLIYDDVVQENPILKGFPAFDLERIEVLAGPQGTLFGRNTPAGVVKFESVKPSKRQDGYLSLSAGTYGTGAIEGAFNLPIGGDWAARVSAQAQHRDDWVSNSSRGTPDMEGYDDRALRLQALYRPSSEFSALFNVHNRDLTGSARVFRANIIKPGTNSLVDGFDPERVAFDGFNRQRLSNTGGSVRLSWQLSGLTLHSITGFETVQSFSRGDVDGGFGASFAPPYGPGFIPFPVETSDALRDHRQLSQEFRVESSSSAATGWQAGLYLFDEKFGITSANYNSLGDRSQTGSAIFTDQTNRAWALFGSVRHKLNADWSLRAGLRTTHDEKTLVTQPDASLQAANGLSDSTSSNKLSWDASAIYTVSPQLNAYGRVATGFRGASIQSASAFAPQSKAAPETLTSFELGLKGDAFEQRARFSGNLFRYNVKDLQLTAVGGGSNATRLLNAKRAMGQGMELNLDAYLTDHFLVTASASLNLTRLQDPDLSVGVCGSCTVLDPKNAAGNALIDGNVLPNAPKWIGNLTARYGIPSASGGEYFIFTDWAARSSTQLFLYDSVEFRAKRLIEGGLRLGYVWDNGKYEVAVFGRNITNNVQVTGAIDFNNLTGFINDPRTFGAQFKAQF